MHLLSRTTRPLFLVTAVVLVALAPAARGQTTVYLDLMEPAAKSAQVTQNCSSWHELYPSYCLVHHQDGFEDNGDGVLSPCDYIVLDGVRFHIQWVGPTYYLSNGEIYEPMQPPTGADPTCEIWHEIYPVFSQQKHVDEWIDNGDHVLSVCDQVAIGGALAHVDRIGVNITIVPGPTPIEKNTWGRIKGFFGRIF
jgi:hypothetical protein